jgi:hypothetical protein
MPAWIPTTTRGEYSPGLPKGVRTVNIYLINEDDQTFCIRAATMSDAVLIAEQLYLEELKNDTEDFNFDREKEYYHEAILKSCALIGELKNNANWNGK